MFSSNASIDRAVCVLLSNAGTIVSSEEAAKVRMLLRKLIQTRRADAELPTEIRAALVESLFAPIASLIVGAVACSIIGAAVALRVGDQWIMANSVAIFAVGMLRVASAFLYKKIQSDRQKLVATKLWERVYEYGAWALRGPARPVVLVDDYADQGCIAAARRHHHASAGYAAAISGRNAGRPFIAVGQLTFSHASNGDRADRLSRLGAQGVGFVVLMFIYGMIDITLSIRDIIIQALTMTRKEAALAARFEEQANRFDIALNNMSHGLCMLDQQDRLQVWNERFLELLHLQNAPIRVGMRISRTGAPQHSRRQSQGQERKGRSSTTCRAAFSGHLRSGSNFARRRSDHRGVAPDDGRRRLRRHP